MMRASYWFALAALAGVGCQPTQTVSDRVSNPSPDVQSNASPKGDSPTSPSGEETTVPAEPPKVQVPVVAEGQDGWAPPGGRSGDSLAQTVDGALAQLRGVQGTFTVELQNEQMAGTMNGVFLIKSPTEFKIESVDGKAPTSIRQDIADGRSLRAADGTRSAVGKKRPVRAAVANFLSDFTALPFRPLTNGAPFLVPLLAELRKEGYEITEEDRKRTVEGELRPFHRIVAARATPAPIERLEIVIDGRRMVPLTIQWTGTSPRGRALAGRWLARWQFNQKVDLP